MGAPISARPLSRHQLCELPVPFMETPRKAQGLFGAFQKGELSFPIFMPLQRQDASPFTSQVSVTAEREARDEQRVLDYPQPVNVHVGKLR